MLCGQPEQKNGVRAIVIGARPRRGLLEGFEPRQALLEQRALMRRAGAGRATSADATMVGVSSPSLGSSGAPLSSRLPTIGRAVPGVDIVEDAHQLVFDEAALLLDDEHVLQALGEAPRALRLPAARSADLVEADAERRGAPSSMPRSSSAWRTSR